MGDEVSQTRYAVRAPQPDQGCKPPLPVKITHAGILWQSRTSSCGSQRTPDKSGRPRTCEPPNRAATDQNAQGGGNRATDGSRARTAPRVQPTAHRFRSRSQPTQASHARTESEPTPRRDTGPNQQREGSPSRTQHRLDQKRGGERWETGQSIGRQPPNVTQKSPSIPKALSSRAMHVDRMTEPAGRGQPARSTHHTFATAIA